MDDTPRRVKPTRRQFIVGAGLLASGFIPHDKPQPVAFTEIPKMDTGQLSKDIKKATEALEACLPAVGEDIAMARKIGFGNIRSLMKGVNTTLITSRSGDPNDGVLYFSFVDRPGKMHQLPGISKLINLCMQLEVLHHQYDEVTGVEMCKREPAINYLELVTQIASKQLFPTPQTGIEHLATKLQETVYQSLALSARPSLAAVETANTQFLGIMEKYRDYSFVAAPYHPAMAVFRFTVRHKDNPVPHTIEIPLPDSKTLAAFLADKRVDANMAASLKPLRDIVGERSAWMISSNIHYIQSVPWHIPVEINVHVVNKSPRYFQHIEEMATIKKLPGQLSTARVP